SDLVVTVDGGSYTPAHLQINPYVPVQITFVRKDASPCAEVIMFPALDISETLPVNQAVLIQLPALAPGKYAFHCQMQMYRGTLTVKPEG
ncbi:MAG: cupredoxin domain-containing protein, partial [Arenicella sp.]|nr:cupredoxin domain-containing protein [Arenicella sp.]